MRTKLFTFVVALFLANLCSGQLHFGAGTQLQFDGTVFGVQGKLFYEYDNTWRGAGTFTFHFDNVANYSIDADVHYKLLDVGDGFNLAPIAGLTLINYDGGSELGLNLGAFIDLDLDGKHVYIEPKIMFVNGGSGLAISAGIFF